MVPETKVAKAKFPAIDVHAHSLRGHQGGGGGVGEDDGRGGSRANDNILTDETGAEFDRSADLYLKTYPDRFQLYCGLDTTDSGASDYPERAVRELVRCCQ